jgi:hypothetical protein
MYAGKARQLARQLAWEHSHQIIGQPEKILGTNTLAYFAGVTLTKEEKFLALGWPRQETSP